MKIDWRNDQGSVDRFIETYKDMSEEQLVDSLAIAVQNVDIEEPRLVKSGLPDNWRATKKNLIQSVESNLTKLREQLCKKMKLEVELHEKLDGETRFSLWIALLANELRDIAVAAEIEPIASNADSVIPGIAAFILLIRATGSIAVMAVEKLCEGVAVERIEAP